MWARKSLWVLFKEEIVGSKGMHIFNFILYCHIALQSGCINVYFYNSAYYCAFSLMVLSDFLNLANIIYRKWYLIMILLGIYLITTEFEHLFKCLLIMLVSSFLDYLVNVIAHFYIRICIANILFQAMAYHLTFLYSDFYWSKVLNFDVVKLTRLCFLEKYSPHYVINMYSYISLAI